MEKWGSLKKLCKICWPTNFKIYVTIIIALCRHHNQSSLTPHKIEAKFSWRVQIAGRAKFDKKKEMSVQIWQKTARTNTCDDNSRPKNKHGWGEQTTTCVWKRKEQHLCPIWKLGSLKKRLEGIFLELCTLHGIVSDEDLQRDFALRFMKLKSPKFWKILEKLSWSFSWHVVSNSTNDVDSTLDSTYAGRWLWRAAHRFRQHIL